MLKRVFFGLFGNTSVVHISVPIPIWFYQHQIVPISNLNREGIHYFFTKKIVSNKFQRKNGTIWYQQNQIGTEINIIDTSHKWNIVQFLQWKELLFVFHYSKKLFTYIHIPIFKYILHPKSKSPISDNMSDSLNTRKIKI